MSLYPEQVRQAVADRVVSTTDAKLSTEPYEWIRANGRSPVHQEIAVGLPRTVPIEARHRPSDGTHATTEVRVLLVYQLETKNRVGSFDTMLILERKIRETLIARGWREGLQLTWGESARIAGPVDGWVLSEQTFTAYYHLPLQ